MTAFDLVFLIVLALSLLLGAWRGLIGELFALVSWIAAFIVANQFADMLAPKLSGIVSAPWLQWAMAFVVIVVLVLLVLALLRTLLREMLSAVGLGATDRLAGAVFGIARGVLIAVVVVACAGFSSLPREQWWRESIFAPPLETIVIALKPWLPKDLAARIKYR
ncbi:CvpA family protein [Uliginosibacterium sp. H3]|uniref:CvpA family protein n=1 Tax=Uliginosibacterium silvisoli TaxID=3114758 RepID=A0ABU6K9K0_9RHOO|nr:CvpA family protein [Uliginosibacterium sp. H3]